MRHRNIHISNINLMLWQKTKEQKQLSRIDPITCVGNAVGIAVGVANLCGSPSSQGDDAADPLHHLPLGDDQQVMDASRLQKVAETDRQTDFRLLPLTQNSGHMVTQVLQVSKSHVPQQSSTDVCWSVPSSSRRSGIGTPTDTTRTGSGYTWTHRQKYRQTDSQSDTQTDSQSVRQTSSLHPCCNLNQTLISN